MSSPSDCYFHADGFCLLSDRACKKACRWLVKRYSELGFREHLDLYTARRQRPVDLFLRWIAVVISVVALAVSALANRDKVFVREPRQEGGPLNAGESTAGRTTALAGSLREAGSVEEKIAVNVGVASTGQLRDAREPDAAR